MRKAILLVSCLALLLLGSGSALAQRKVSASYQLPRIYPAAEFSLVSHLGTQTRLSTFRGRVVLLTFVYANCPGACPLVTGKFLGLHRELKRRAGGRPQVQLLSVTVDPQSDNAAALAAYARQLGVRDESWLFLTGSDAEVQAVLDAYSLWRKKLPNGLVDHVMRVYLIDRHGDVREIYDSRLLSVDLVLQDIDTLQ